LALDKLPFEIWEHQVKNSTIFSSWQEMLNRAGEEYNHKYIQ